MLELFGVEEANNLVARAARLIGLQFYDEIAKLLNCQGTSAVDFAVLLASLAVAQGEKIDLSSDANEAVIVQHGWRLMAGIEQAELMFSSWNALWQGALAVHNRSLVLHTDLCGKTVSWRIVGQS